MNVLQCLNLNTQPAVTCNAAHTPTVKVYRKPITYDPVYIKYVYICNCICFRQGAPAEHHNPWAAC